MISSAALTRSAVSSTMQGGLPAPAPMTFFPAFHAHSNNASTTGNRQNCDFRVRHHLLGSLKSGFCDRDDKIPNPAAAKSNIFNHGNQLQ